MQQFNKKTYHVYILVISQTSWKQNFHIPFYQLLKGSTDVSDIEREKNTHSKSARKGDIMWQDSILYVSSLDNPRLAKVAAETQTQLTL